MSKEQDSPSKTPEEGIGGEDPCPICLGEVRGATTTACGHTFCTGCLDQVTDRQGRCPMCREPGMAGAEAARQREEEERHTELARLFMAVRLTDEPTARGYLQDAGWDLQLAESTYEEEVERTLREDEEERAKQGLSLDWAVWRDEKGEIYWKARDLKPAEEWADVEPSGHFCVFDSRKRQMG